MDKLIIVPAAGLAMLLALLLGACKPDTTTPHRVPADVNAKEACAQIHHAIDAATLDTVDGQLQIKLAAARDGVPDSIRAAIDEYYRGDRLAGRQAMLKSCADAGFPVQPK